jgi:CheY-like chemotaxis protein
VLRILIADDNDDLRRRVRSLIESQHSWVVCGEAGNGREALELVGTLRPDVVLLDISMPEIGGLEVMRRIAAESRDIDVIVMSAHRTKELAREVIRAGARAFIDKAEAYERLAPALKALRREVHLAGRVVGSRHIGAFFHCLDEAYRVLGPYICDGLEHGEKAVHIIDAVDHQAHMHSLAGCNVDVPQLRSNGQLELLSWEDVYLRNERFDVTAMLGLVQELLRKGPPAGYPRSRLMGRMEWALQDVPGVDSLLEYETRLNYILPQYDDIVTCCYDLSRFDAGVISDVMRSHPALLIGDEFHENPHYVSPDLMLEELQQR